MPIQMQKHSGATPSIASEQIIDDRHEKNFCVLTKIENVAEMSSVAESYPREGSWYGWRNFPQTACDHAGQDVSPLFTAS